MRSMACEGRRSALFMGIIGLFFTFITSASLIFNSLLYICPDL